MNKAPIDRAPLTTAYEAQQKSKYFAHALSLIWQEAIGFARSVEMDKANVEDMLETIIDCHYGTSGHHIGDGDGIPEGEADRIRQWWEARLERVKQEAGK